VETLAGLADRLAAEHGSRVALVEGDRTLTFDGLCAAAGALADDLAGWGVGRGDVVALWLPNLLEYLVAEFALAALGAAALGVNTRYGEHDVTHLLERGRPVGVVVPYRFLDIDFVAMLPRPGPWVGVVGAPADADLHAFDIGGGVHRLADPTADIAWADVAWARAAARGSSAGGSSAGGSSEGGSSEGGSSAGGSSAAGAAVAAAARVGGSAALRQAGRPEDPVAYFTTSGSTGAPKLAGHPQAAVASTR
jgi:acyl-CoA synthetase (AMP-forming)/AMP-acid ligase II